jgi:hypothetical protein
LVSFVSGAVRVPALENDPQGWEEGTADPGGGGPPDPTLDQVFKVGGGGAGPGDGGPPDPTLDQVFEVGGGGRRTRVIQV